MRDPAGAFAIQAGRSLHNPAWIGAGFALIAYEHTLLPEGTFTHGGIFL
jgi:hypothetical protein